MGAMEQMELILGPVALPALALLVHWIGKSIVRALVTKRPGGIESERMDR